MIFNISVYETLVCVDLGILVFICLFLFACGDIACFYWKMEMKKLYRKVRKDKELECEHEESLRYKKRRSVKVCDSNKMLKPKPERHLQLENMGIDDEINSSDSSRRKPLLKDLIREEILRSMGRVKVDSGQA
jgi:hypothetical protein